MREEGKKMVYFCPRCGIEVRPTARFCPLCACRIFTKEWTIEVTGEDAVEVQTVAQSLVSNMTKKKKSTVPSPWLSGSFYLAAFIAIGTLLLVIANIVHPLVLPIVIIGAVLAVSVVGALQLRQDRNLTEKNFLALMRLTFSQLPFVRRENKNENSQPKQN